jgi:hypothetical protein
MCPNIATPLAVACRERRRHRSTTPGCSSWTPSPAIRRQNPSSRGRRTEGACLGAAGLHSGYLRSPGLDPGTRKDPDPRRRSSRGSGPQNRPARPATAAARRMRPVPSTTSWRYGSQPHMPSRNHNNLHPHGHLTDQARLALPAVTHRYKRIHCLWLEQFQSIICSFVEMSAIRYGRSDHPALRGDNGRPGLPALPRTVISCCHRSMSLGWGVLRVVADRGQPRAGCPVAARRGSWWPPRPRPFAQGLTAADSECMGACGRTAVAENHRDGDQSDGSEKPGQDRGSLQAATAVRRFSAAPA